MYLSTSIILSVPEGITTPKVPLIDGNEADCGKHSISGKFPQRQSKSVKNRHYAQYTEVNEHFSTTKFTLTSATVYMFKNSNMMQHSEASGFTALEEGTFLKTKKKIPAMLWASFLGTGGREGDGTRTNIPLLFLRPAFLFL